MAHPEKKETETDSTEKIKKDRKGLRKFFIGAVCVLAIVLAFWFIPSRHVAVVESAVVPLSSAPAATAAVIRPSCTMAPTWANETPMADWPKEELPPHQASAHIQKCVDTHIRWAGPHLIIHAIYSDRKECVMNPGVICPDGAETEEYVINDSDQPAIAQHALAHQGEP